VRLPPTRALLTRPHRGVPLAPTPTHARQIDLSKRPREPIGHDRDRLLPGVLGRAGHGNLGRAFGDTRRSGTPGCSIRACLVRVGAVPIVRGSVGPPAGGVAFALESSSNRRRCGRCRSTVGMPVQRDLTLRCVWSRYVIYPAGARSESRGKDGSLFRCWLREPARPGVERWSLSNRPRPRLAWAHLT
jgi:hypothetical protein